MAIKSLTTREIIGTFYARLEADPASALLNQIAWFNRSTDQEIETYKWLGQVPRMREWLGGRQAKGFNDFSHVIKNRPYEASLGINLPDFERDKTSQVLTRIGELADAANIHQWSLIADLMQKGESQACYDGQFMYDTDHSEGDSGTQSNDITAPAVAPTAPTVIEMSDAIFKAITNIMNVKDDRGEPMNEFARRFTLMVAPSLFDRAITAVTATNLDAGKTNPLFKLQDAGYTISVHVTPRLSMGAPNWTNRFAVFRTDAEMKPFILQIEKPLATVVLGPESEYAKVNNELLFSVDGRWGAGYGLWQYSVLVTFT